MVGLYYGFLTTFSIGPSYLLHLRTILVKKGEEGAENKVSATMGFIMGQLMMFISIYYTPLHLALDRPHTKTALTIPNPVYSFISYGTIEQTFLIMIMDMDMYLPTEIQYVILGFNRYSCIISFFNY
jgi:hypothetical protein